MATEFCAEDVVIQMSPQAEIIGSGGAGSAGGAEAARGAGSGGAALELGRRLLVAARAGHTALVFDLMAKGAPFTTDWLGTSPLHLAAGGDHADTAGVLLRAGVSRDARTKVERTPLHVAAHAGHVETAEVLLQHGALVDCRDLLRMTPLHWAADRGHAAVVSLLLQYGADPAAVSKFYKTPIQLAIRRGRTAIVALLEDAVRQREAARSVRALVEERLVEEQPAVDSLSPHKENVEKIPEIITSTTTTELPKLYHIKATKVKKAPEKPAKLEEKLQETLREAMETGQKTDGGAAAILRRHGITLLAPDHGTVLRALQGGRSVALSDAGKLMLQESGRAPPRTTRPSAEVKLVQLPTEARATVRRVTNIPSPSTVKSRPPVKIIMNKSNFQRLVAGVQKPKQNSFGEALTMTVINENSVKGDDEVASLKAQLAASQRTVQRLTEELKSCRAKLARYEAQ